VHVSETAAGARQGRPGKSAERRNVFQRIGLWWRQIIAELRKVIWPTRRELYAYTIVTLVFAVVVIGLVFLLDYGANWGVLKLWGH